MRTPKAPANVSGLFRSQASPLCGAFLFLEIGMKSKYRCLVEDVLSCERKLRELRDLQVDAQEKLKQTDAAVSYQEASLRKLELELAEIEPAAAERARKYTSANGAVELNCATGELKLGGFSLGRCRVIRR